jgi:hypothetical protein
MSDILNKIIATKHEEIAAARAVKPLAAVEAKRQPRRHRAISSAPSAARLPPASLP